MNIRVWFKVRSNLGAKIYSTDTKPFRKKCKGPDLDTAGMSRDFIWKKIVAQMYKAC